MTEYNTDSQLMHFDGLLNARELGGMPLRGGKVFATGLAIRSDSPSDLTHEQALAIRDHGVTQVLDLRSEAEVKAYGNAFMDLEGVKFKNIPLFLGNPDDKEDPTMEFLKTHKLGDFYLLILEQLGDRVCEVLRAIKDNEGITLYHCAHGKDRTGVISAILYLLAGASYENIIKNYACSYTYMKPILDPLIARDLAPGGRNMAHVLRSDAENMEIFLNYVDSEYNGKIENFLMNHGMSANEIEELKKRF